MIPARTTAALAAALVLGLDAAAYAQGATTYTMVAPVLRARGR